MNTSDPEYDNWFPPVDEYSEDVVAVGGDLSTRRLLAAYRKGIFPWYNVPGKIWWWHPVERAILITDRVHISKSMRNVLNRGVYTCTFDRAFAEVVDGCRGGDREGNTWLHQELRDALMELHHLGYAHSVETWHGGRLVGGLYGVSIGRMFFGESMFSIEPNASKTALIFLARRLHHAGFPIIDCQVYNEHLGSLGAIVISRENFIELHEVLLAKPDISGSWDQHPEFGLASEPLSPGFSGIRADHQNG